MKSEVCERERERGAREKACLHAQPVGPVQAAFTVSSASCRTFAHYVWFAAYSVLSGVVATLWRSFDVSFQLRGFNERGRAAGSHGLHRLGGCTVLPRCNLTCGAGCEADQRQSFVGITNGMLCRPLRLLHALTHAPDSVHGGRKAAQWQRDCAAGCRAARMRLHAP